MLLKFRRIKKHVVTLHNYIYDNILKVKKKDMLLKLRLKPAVVSFQQTTGVGWWDWWASIKIIDIMQNRF